MGETLGLSESEPAEARRTKRNTHACRCLMGSIFLGRRLRERVDSLNEFSNEVDVGPCLIQSQGVPKVVARAL
jgi:hypothetical protein